MQATADKVLIGICALKSLRATLGALVSRFWTGPGFWSCFLPLLFAERGDILRDECIGVSRLYAGSSLFLLIFFTMTVLHGTGKAVLFLICHYVQ